MLEVVEDAAEFVFAGDGDIEGDVDHPLALHADDVFVVGVGGADDGSAFGESGDHAGGGGAEEGSAAAVAIGDGPGEGDAGDGVAVGIEGAGGELDIFADVDVGGSRSDLDFAGHGLDGGFDADVLELSDDANDAEAEGAEFAALADGGEVGVVGGPDDVIGAGVALGVANDSADLHGAADHDLILVGDDLDARGGAGGLREERGGGGERE